MIKKFAAALLFLACAQAPAVPLGSHAVLVVENGTGKVLLEKNADMVVPIASLTKLMTAMVVLDAKLDMDERIRIDDDDVDRLKYSRSRVPVGATLSRADVLHLALMSSDNRAAAALARTFPGGPARFQAAVDAKLRALGMTQTRIHEPTGLSPANTSTAEDLVRMATAAAGYPAIKRLTTDKRDIMRIQGRQVEYHNTNRLVGARGWNIRLSKTGYTSEAGRCLIMRVRAAGKSATMVLLNAGSSAARVADALNIRRMLAGREAPKASARKVARRNAPARKRRSR
ncbi:serine hydrolase [Massilia sp. METH4]|uniref:serine hydrolase n=1 Tax=Massilia sp. METH4 TaxID=3123041 RepID=UPI0030D3D930